MNMRPPPQLSIFRRPCWSSQGENSSELLSDLKTQLEQLKLNLRQEGIERVLESELVQQWEDCFQEHVADIRRNGSDFAKFWITYL